MRWTVALVWMTLGAMGCGSTCQSACQLLYSPSECNLPTPGQDWDEKNKQCIDECELALSKPGEVGDYNPDEKYLGGEDIVLNNERQAALWMDCVMETSCENLESGYCEPN